MGKGHSCQGHLYTVQWGGYKQKKCLILAPILYSVYESRPLPNKTVSQASPQCHYDEPVFADERAYVGLALVVYPSSE